MANLSNINNKFIVEDDGDVGIGVTSATAKLHIRDGGTNADVGIKIGNDSRDWNMKVMGSVSDSFQIFTHDNSNILTILSSGNVGIGTIEPQAALTVAHDLSNGGDATGFRLNAASGATSNTLFGGPVSSGDYAFFQSYKEGTSAGIRDLSLNPIGGNVGIGTTGPDAKLTVGDPGGATTRSIQIEGNTSTAGIAATIGVFSNSTYLSTNYYYNSAQTQPVSTFGQTSIVQTTSATTGGNWIDFKVSDHTDANNAPDVRMRILDSGNVGIGTSTPANKIQGKYSPVAIGNLTATNDASSTTNFNVNAGLLIEDSNTSNGLALGVSGQANDRKSWIQSGHPTSLYAANLGTLSINPLGGNVGIGTDSPNAKLDVKNNDGVTSGLHIVADINQNAGAGAQMILGYYANGSAAVGPLIYAANGMPQLINASGGINFSHDLSFSSNFTYTFRDGVGINNPNSQSAGGNAGYVMYVGRSSSGTVLGSISAMGTIRGSAFTSGTDTPAGIGTSLGDVNAGELGPGYINLSRDDTAAAEQIRFEKNGVLHSYIKTNADALIIGNNALAINPPAGKYGFIQHGISNICSSGYVNGNATLSFDYDCVSTSSMFIECVMNHYGYIATYGCSRIATMAVGPVIQIQNIQEITSGNGGSWTFNRVSNTRFNISKTAGTYAGGGYYMINIRGNGLKYT